MIGYESEAAEVLRLADTGGDPGLLAVAGVLFMLAGICARWAGR